MGGSAADTPTTPESLRASDAERDHAVDELKKEFIDGRLSHETFMYRMQTALGARDRGQLAGLFTDLPPRRPRLLARMWAVLCGRRPEPQANEPQGMPAPPVPQGPLAVQPPHGMAAFGGMAGHGAYHGQSAAWPGPVGVPGEGSGSGQQPGPMPLSFPPGSGTSFTIGRTQECDLRIADLSVSRLHARLVRVEDGWLLRDLGSHNGTRVNGWLVREPVPVRAGDHVQFGSATFVIQADGGTGSSPREEGEEGLGG